MKRYRYQILSGFTGTTNFQLPVYLEASVDEMGIMSAFDGEFEQIQQFANFTYKSGIAPTSPVPSPTGSPCPVNPSVTPSPTPTIDCELEGVEVETTPCVSVTPSITQTRCYDVSPTPTPTPTPTVSSTPATSPTPTPTPSCERPGGLTNYSLLRGYDCASTGFTYTYGSLTTACEAQSLVYGGGGCAGTGATVKIGSLVVGALVYTFSGTGCDTYAQNGYYPISGTGNIYHIVSGVITEILTCPSVTPSITPTSSPSVTPSVTPTSTPTPTQTPSISPSPITDFSVAVTSTLSYNVSKVIIDGVTYDSSPDFPVLPGEVIGFPISTTGLLEVKVYITKTAGASDSIELRVGGVIEDCQDDPGPTTTFNNVTFDGSDVDVTLDDVGC